MSLRVNNNIAAFNAYRNLTVTDGQMAKSLEKLSSGYRINRAGDDAAGLVISEGLRAQIGGLKVAQRNAQDGISVVQTAEGALNEVTSMLQRIRDLSVQAKNGSNNTTAVQAAQDEANQLLSAISDIATQTTFNGTALLTGGGTMTFQVGANDNETLVVSLADVSAAISQITSYAVDSGNLSDLDAAITAISSSRGGLGAAQNRLEHTIANLGVAVENLTASESRIRDTDMASEMTQFTRAQILSQAGTAMLAQANQSSQGVLQLLRG